MDTSSAFAWLKSTVIWARRSTKKASMRDPRRVSNQTWLESTELATIWSQGITGDGGWNTNVFAMAAPIAYAAALVASAAVQAGGVGSSPSKQGCYSTGAVAQSLPAL